MTRDGLISGMEEVAEHLDFVINVWGRYRDKSEERKEAELARTLINKIDKDYLHRNT